MLKKLIRINDWAAFKLMAVYGCALTIWVLALYSLMGALVSSKTQVTMLYWSNAAQLVYCPLSIYVGNKIMQHQKKQTQSHEDLKAKVDAIHEKVSN